MFLASEVFQSFGIFGILGEGCRFRPRVCSAHAFMPKIKSPVVRVIMLLALHFFHRVVACHLLSRRAKHGRKIGFVGLVDDVFSKGFSVVQNDGSSAGRLFNRDGSPGKRGHRNKR